jgi:glucose-1-phosphate thymidylyltransferase
MKGIILAGGKGTRLFPLTQVISKQLLPIYDKPMVYYSLSTLLLAGIREILLISSPSALPQFQQLLGSGEKWGLTLSYAEQQHPNGIADSFLVAESYFGQEKVCLILGDNIFFGQDLSAKLQLAAKLDQGALIFAYQIKNPNQYGVVEFDNLGYATNIEEKPKIPKSNFAVPGLYFYDSKVWGYAKELIPSKRNELEITDLNLRYIRESTLKVHVLGRGTAWLDAGTHSSLLQAANFVQIVEERQGMKIACLEELAFRMGFIDIQQLSSLAKEMSENSYRDYLFEIIRTETG